MSSLLLSAQTLPAQQSTAPHIHSHTAANLLLLLRCVRNRDNPSVATGLDYVATWNAAMLPQSADVRETFLARAEGRRPAYSKL